MIGSRLEDARSGTGWPLSTFPARLLAKSQCGFDRRVATRSLLGKPDGRSGTLWEGRYPSTLVDADNFLLTAYRYIELNPVRADRVDHASDYPWSSYPGNAVGKPITLLTSHPLYRRLGKTDEAQQAAYRALFRGRKAERDGAAIGDATNQAWVLGDGRPKAQIEATTGRRPAPSRRGGDRKSAEFHKGRNQ